MKDDGGKDTLENINLWYILCVPHSHRPPHTASPNTLVTSLLIFLFPGFWPTSSIIFLCSYLTLIHHSFHARWMTRCNAWRSAHWKDFPSQLSFGDTIEWGCSATAVHFQLALHIRMTCLWTICWAFSFSMSSLSGPPHVAVGSCRGRGAMQLTCAFHLTYAWCWFATFILW